MQFMMSHKMDEASLLSRLTVPADSSKMIRLVQGIHRNKFETDTQAATALYGNTRSMDAYRHLKARLRRRLINQTIHSERIGQTFSPV